MPSTYHRIRSGGTHLLTSTRGSSTVETVLLVTVGVIAMFQTVRLLGVKPASIAGFVGAAADHRYVR